MADQEKIEVVETPETETVAPVEEVAAKTAPAPEPTRLSEIEVTALLEAEKRLPAASRVRLAEGQYEDGEKVGEAITKELAYLKEVVGSGKPFALGDTPPAPPKTFEERLAEANKRLDNVNRKWLHNGGGNG